MRFALVPILLAAVLAVTGCPSSSLSTAASDANRKMEAQGLPFRYSVQDTGSGEGLVLHMQQMPVGQTRADANTKNEILEAILQKEKSKGRIGADIKDVHPMQDGREVWTLQSLHGGIAYVVSLGDPRQSVVKIGLLGPYNYAQ